MSTQRKRQLSDVAQDKRGGLLATYGVNRHELVYRSILVSMVLLLIILFTMLYLLGQTSLEDYILMVGACLVGIFLLALTLLRPIWLAQRRGHYTAIYRNGIERNGEFYAWEAIDAINGHISTTNIYGVPIASTGSYALYQGNKILVNLMPLDEHVEHIVYLVNQGLIRTYKARYLHELSEGKVLDFRRAKLSAERIQYARKHDDLVDVSRAEVTDYPHVVINGHNEKVLRAFDLDAFDNPRLFVELVNELVRA